MAKKRVSKKVIRIVNNYNVRLKQQEKLPIERVIVFGSQINRKNHKWSDIDVCIISPKFKEPVKAIKFLLQKRDKKEVAEGLEPVGFTKEDFMEGGGFIQEIKKTCVALV